MTKRTTELMALDSIKRATSNPKRHDVRAIMRSMMLNGFGEAPMLDERTGRLIAGHGRLEALTALRLEKKEPPKGVETRGEEWLVPIQRGWASKNDAEAKAYLVASNRTTELGGWDDSELNEMLSDIAKDGAETLAAAGYDGAELEKMLSDANPVEPDEAPALVEKPWVKTGDLFQLGEHRILCGDSTKADDVARAIDGRCDVMFTSPPYALGKSASLSGNKLTGQRGNAYDLHEDNAAEWPELMRGFTEAARGSVDCMAINVQPLAGNKRALMSWAAENVTFLVDLMVWNKGHAAPQMAAGVLTSSFELVFIFAAANASRSIPHSSWRGNVSSVVDISPQRNNEFANKHSATMPVALASHFVGVVFDACKTVFEPFSGTGTTIIACEQLGKKCRAIELSPAYVQISVERWEKFTGKKHVKL